MTFSISSLNKTWDRNTLETRLTELASPIVQFLRFTYIRPNLTLHQFDRESTGYKIAKSLDLVNFAHGIDNERTKSVLLELKPQVDKTNDQRLISLLRNAMLNFNIIAPQQEITLEDLKVVQEMHERKDDLIRYNPASKRNFPPILKRTPDEYYPTSFLTRPVLPRDERGNLVAQQLVKRDQVAKEYGYDAIADIQSFENIFNKFLIDRYRFFDLSIGAFDLHDVCFQNLALKLTRSLSDQELRQPQTQAERHLIRARNYAIGSRNDIGWKGEVLTDAERQMKQKEMEANWQSIKLRDWAGLAENYEKPTASGNLPQKITVTDEDTQTAVERLAKSYPTDKICWVNMANAHKVGGGYQRLDVAQEEVVTTNSDAIVVLTNLGGRDPEGNVLYRNHLHIPPGGNYFHKTRFITGDQVHCNSIAHAFADFRDAIFAERQDFLVPKEKLAIGTSEYRKRIKLDMRGVLRTAIAEKQEVLVLSATGCGAFCHDPLVESLVWKEVLQEPEFKGRFQEIVFAILFDQRNPRNVIAFQNTFK